MNQNKHDKTVSQVRDEEEKTHESWLPLLAFLLMFLLACIAPSLSSAAPGDFEIIPPDYVEGC